MRFLPPRSAAVLSAAITALAATPSHGYFTVGQPIPLDATRPQTMPGSLRGVRVPVRVHGQAATGAAELVAALGEAERAYEAIVDRLGFTPPLFDATRGGGPELDIYLTDESSFVRVDPDGLDYGEAWDCSAAVVRVRRGLSAAQRRRAITEGVAHASLLAADARTTRAYRVAFASAIAARVLGEGADEEGLVRASAEVSNGLFSESTDEAARGEAVFFDLLASRYDDGSLSLWRGLAVAPIARTEGGASRLEDEPDSFDLLRRLLRSEPGGLDGFILEYTAARAVAGTPGDRFDTVGFRALAKLAAEPMRTIVARDLPEWVLSQRPLPQGGAALVAVDTNGLREGTLSLWFHGASWRRWTVAALRLDAFDRDRGRAPAPPVNDGEWSTTMELGPGDSRVLVVIVDQGNQLLDLDRPTNRDGSFALNLSLSNAR
ncbi:MAG: hypothetical protein JNK05_29315 [Myxococcales bacterium]|nr:hypothetical protein [Myxococcales bacterium]